MNRTFCSDTNSAKAGFRSGAILAKLVVRSDQDASDDNQQLGEYMTS